MYWHPYDIEARNQLLREHAEKLERDMRSTRKLVASARPGLTERIVLAFLPKVRRRRAAATAAAPAEAAPRP
jgi:hypothetical protein